MTLPPLCLKCKSYHKPPECDFDPEFPCVVCGKPVEALSVGGSAVCPWCDMGKNRDLTRWTDRQAILWMKGEKIGEPT